MSEVGLMIYDFTAAWNGCGCAARYVIRPSFFVRPLGSLLTVYRRENKLMRRNGGYCYIAGLGYLGMGV